MFKLKCNKCNKEIDLIEGIQDESNKNGKINVYVSDGYFQIFCECGNEITIYN
ncbi:hypothetical protein [Inediibacterium massiliense]|uniref:hypothetical protein n=1 Tax=Inediibacterium massiliense TaxID=1658111 RepID=UPI0018FEE5D9|nr:hypothetical protein [Inediibacterium massiliense]